MLGKKRIHITRSRLKIMWRLLSIYTFILIIPIIVAVIMYRVQIVNIERSIVVSRTNTLDLNKRIVESAIITLDDIIADIRTNEDLAKLLSEERPLRPTQTLRVQNIYNELRLSGENYPNILDVQVYLKRSNLLLTFDDIFFDPSVYYRSFFKIPEKEYPQWISEMRSDAYINREIGFNSVFIKGEEKEVITVTVSLPENPRIKSSGLVVGIVDRSELKNLLALHITHPSGFAYIQLTDGRLLASVGINAQEYIPADYYADQAKGTFSVDIDKKQYVVSYIRSASNEWLYVAGIPEEVFFEQSKIIKTIFIILTLIILFIGIPAAVLQAVGFSKPIEAMMETLQDAVSPDQQYENPLWFISESVNQLVIRDKKLAETIEEQRPLVQKVVLDRLFRGEFRNETEAQSYLVHFGIEDIGPNYALFAVAIEGYFDSVTLEVLKEFTVKSTLVEKALLEILPSNSIIHAVYHNLIGVIVSVDDEWADIETSASTDEILSNISSHLKSLREIRCTVVLSGVASMLQKIPSNLQKAISIIEWSQPGETLKGELGKNSGDGKNDYYFFPIELESMLLKAIRSGAVDDVKSITEEIRERNLEDRKLSSKALRQLNQELDAARVKAEQFITKSALPNFKLNPSLHANERINLHLENFKHIASCVSEINQMSSKLKDPIKQFVRGNVFDKNMSLKLLAAHFNLSEAYVSRLFKDLFDQNFHSFVEDHRMTEAAHLLRESTLNIAEIAERVGYFNTRTFRRVFLQHYGVSPSRYQQR